MGATTLEYSLNGARSTAFISDTASLADSVELAHSLKTYTNAGFSRVGFTVADNSQVEPETPGVDYAALSYVGLIFFRDEDGAIVKLAIPAPIKSQYYLDGKTLRLKQEHGEAIASLLGAKTGKTLTFSHGSVTTRSYG